MARRGLMTLETTEPLSVCVGQDVVRKFNAREQKFLIGRAVLGLLNKTAVLSKLSQGETADLFGNSIRIHAPQFTALGRQERRAGEAAAQGVLAQGAQGAGGARAWRWETSRRWT